MICSSVYRFFTSEPPVFWGRTLNHCVTQKWGDVASTAVASGAAIKFGIVSGVGVVLSAAIVMAMTLPKTKVEWLAGLVSTVAGSAFGGAFLVQQYQLAQWIDQGYFGIAGLIAVMFAAGLPAWVLVRAFFRYFQTSKGKTIVEMIKEFREAWKKPE